MVGLVKARTNSQSPAERRRASSTAVTALRASGTLHFEDIPVSRYKKTVRDEVENIPAKDLINIYRDMVYIREFETMLNLIKTTSEYQGVSYTHPGPAHLGIGQEAAYVGQAYHLNEEDFSFGSHRSHGEILARGLRAVETMDTDKLSEIMGAFAGGNIRRVVDGGRQDIRAVGRDFLLYGMIGTSGLRILVDQRVDYGKSRNLAMTSVIFVTGLSGIAIHVGNIQITGMALACVVGMLMGLVFFALDKAKLTNDRD